MKSSHFYRSCTSQTLYVLWRLLIDWSLNYCFVKLGLFLLVCFLSLKMCSMDDLFISTPTNPPHHGSRLESQMALPEFSFEHLYPQMVVFFQGAVEPKEVGPMWQNSSLKMDFWRLHLALCCLLPALMWSLPWWAEIWNLGQKKKKKKSPFCQGFCGSGEESIVCGNSCWGHWYAALKVLFCPVYACLDAQGGGERLFCEMSVSVLYAQCADEGLRCRIWCYRS